jgi:hypothetical protein
MLRILRAPPIAILVIAGAVHAPVWCVWPCDHRPRHRRPGRDLTGLPQHPLRFCACVGAALGGATAVVFPSPQAVDGGGAPAWAISIAALVALAWSTPVAWTSLGPMGRRLALAVYGFHALGLRAWRVGMQDGAASWRAHAAQHDAAADRRPKRAPRLSAKTLGAQPSAGWLRQGLASQRRCVQRNSPSRFAREALSSGASSSSGGKYVPRDGRNQSYELVNPNGLTSWFSRRSCQAGGVPFGPWSQADGYFFGCGRGRQCARFGSTSASSTRSLEAGRRFACCVRDAGRRLQHASTTCLIGQRSPFGESRAQCLCPRRGKEGDKFDVWMASSLRAPNTCRS